MLNIDPYKCDPDIDPYKCDPDIDSYKCDQDINPNKYLPELTHTNIWDVCQVTCKGLPDIDPKIIDVFTDNNENPSGSKTNEIYQRNVQ